MTKSLEALVASEIADFFCGFVEIHTELGGPNTIDEAQQQLTERVTRIASECEAALIAALEQAQKSNEFLKGQLAELANFNPDWDKLEASYESWREIAAELLTAKNRIAELEARPLCVNPDAMREVAPLCVKLPELFEDDRHAVTEAIRAAGGTVEGSN